MGFFDEIANRLNEYKVQRPQQIFADQYLQGLPMYPIQYDGKFHRRNFVQESSDLKCKSLTARTPLKNFQSFVAFDTETTGISLSGNGIIEISAIRFVEFAPQCIFTTLIKPQKPIPPEATAVNHITNDMVANAPYFYQIIPSLEAFLGNSPMVAHNALFDMKHLYADGMDSVVKKKVYDTCEISKKINKSLPNHKLITACGAHNIFLGEAHRAYSDAMACGLLFVQFLMMNYGCYNTNDLLSKMYFQ